MKRYEMGPAEYTRDLAESSDENLLSKIQVSLHRLGT